jgi:hypothetical protein
MPAPQLHLTFGSLVQDQAGLDPALRAACRAEPVYARLGAIFHDLPYYGNMLAEAIRYGLERPALDEPWAYRMHAVRPDRFVASFVRAAATSPLLSRDEGLALVGGLVSHCALDLTLHPLVNYCARRDVARVGGYESMHHRLAEKYHSLFFHLDRFGYDPIGSAEFRRWTRVVKEGSALRARAEAPILSFVDDAYRGAYGNAPSAARWSGWVRSFQHFGLLVATPWAARNSQRKRRDPSLRAHYFENQQFSFFEFYAASERRLVELGNLAAAYFRAGDFSRAAKEAFTRAARIDDLTEGDSFGLPALPSLAPPRAVEEAAPRAMIIGAPRLRRKVGT